MRHARRAARPLALLLAAQAACTDAPTAPAAGGAASLAAGATAEPVVATPIVVSTYVLLQVRDVGGVLVPTTTVEFTATDGPGRSASKTVTDNGAGDADLRVGHYRVVMPFTNTANAYEARLVSAPVQYASFGAFARGSYGGPTTDIGTMTLRRRPVITLRMRSGGFGFLVGGAAIAYDASGSGVLDTRVADNGWGDLDPTVGEISFRVLNNATWTVCETTPPTNMRLASPSCLTVQAPFDGSATYDVYHAAL